MTFEQWQETHQYTWIPEAEDMVHAYDDGSFIYETGDGEYGVIIGNTDQTFKLLEAAEAHLWENWSKDNYDD